MGILDIFKRKTNSNSENVETPDELKHLISQKDFNSILNFATIYLTEKENKNIDLVDGILLYEPEDNNVTSNQTNFLNLVKSILCEERKDWKVKTFEYFERLNLDMELEKEVLLNFEKAKEYLTVRLYPFSTYQDEPLKSQLDSMVYLIDIPETYSMLALDLPSRFHILTIKELNVWGIDKTSLFKIAFNNLQDKIANIQVQKHDWEGAVMYTLFDRNYSSAYCIDFANNCDNLIGENGTLISYPARGSVFVHPITTKEQFIFGYNHIAEKTNNFFDDEHGPISRNIYWYYKNNFTLFEMKWNNEELTYDIPKDLINLLDL